MIWRIIYLEKYFKRPTIGEPLRLTIWTSFILKKTLVINPSCCFLYGDKSLLLRFIMACWLVIQPWDKTRNRENREKANAVVFTIIHSKPICITRSCTSNNFNNSNTKKNVSIFILWGGVLRGDNFTLFFLASIQCH